ncbi:MAG: YfcE family phosphodiesterase [Planctomycetes bacterium]|nr:YfcE family phosphodiesterase [Planctomycetota bacterium]
MRLAVISDTHGHVGYAQEAVELLQALEVQRVIHCGDIGSPAIPPLLAAWPTDYVLGNVDRDEAALCGAIDAAGHRLHGRFGALELEGRRIAFLHSDDERLFRETIRSGDWDLVCYGHTHKAESHREGNLLVLNPGALYRAARHSIAVVELPQLEASHIIV